jgi:hypothetical protein
MAEFDKGRVNKMMRKMRSTVCFSHSILMIGTTSRNQRSVVMAGLKLSVDHYSYKQRDHSRRVGTGMPIDE